MHRRCHFLSNYPLDMPVEDVIDRYEPVFAAMNFYGDAYPKWWTNFGPGIMAGFVGATVNSVSDPSETVWYTPSQHVPITDLGDRATMPDNVWWQRVKDFTAAIVERWDGTSRRRPHGSGRQPGHPGLAPRNRRAALRRDGPPRRGRPAGGPDHRAVAALLRRTGRDDPPGMSRHARAGRRSGPPARPTCSSATSRI